MAKDIKRTVYLSESEFAEISKKMKGVKSYPNPYIKECGNVRYQIIPDGEEIAVRTLTDAERDWFAPNNKSQEVVIAFVSILCWFPIDLIAGVENGRYSQNTTLSEKTGWLSSSSALGSQSVLFLKDKVDAALGILKEHGFKINNHIQ